MPLDNPAHGCIDDTHMQEQSINLYQKTTLK
jgi:hypothetical protein